jgi:hypothetical protein
VHSYPPLSYLAFSSIYVVCLLFPWHYRSARITSLPFPSIEFHLPSINFPVLILHLPIWLSYIDHPQSHFHTRALILSACLFVLLALRNLSTLYICLAISEYQLCICFCKLCSFQLHYLFSSNQENQPPSCCSLQPCPAIL